MLTVGRIHENILPLSSSVLAGARGLQRRVGWVTLLRKEWLCDPDDLVLTHEIEDEEHFEALRALGAVGAILASAPPSVVTAQADLESFPVLLLPEGVRLRDVEKEITRALVMSQESDVEFVERNQEALLGLLVDDKGLDEIVHALARLTGKAALLQDKRLRIIASTVPPEFLNGWQAVEERLLHFSTLPEIFRDRHRLREQPSSLIQPLADYNLERMIAPVVSGGVGRGFLSLVGFINDFSSSDASVIEYGALMCALDMLKAKAISETEKRLRGDILDSIIAGEWQEDEIQEHISRLRHKLTDPHVILVARWRGDVHPSIRRLETLTNGAIKAHRIDALVRPYSEEVRIFYRIDSSNPTRDARRLAEIIQQEGKREYPNSAIAFGIGALAESLRGWRASYLDAAAAADFARRTHATNPLDAREIGVYRFLAAPGNREALRAIRDDILGDLLEYDQRQGGELLLTLEGFFNSNGHLSQTAEALHVHRNTLQYRLTRIGELTQLDMSQPDTRLAIQLAVKAKRLLDGEIDI